MLNARGILGRLRDGHCERQRSWRREGPPARLRRHEHFVWEPVRYECRRRLQLLRRRGSDIRPKKWDLPGAVRARLLRRSRDAPNDGIQSGQLFDSAEHHRWLRQWYCVLRCIWQPGLTNQRKSRRQGDSPLRLWGVLRLRISARYTTVRLRLGKERLLSQDNDDGVRF